MFKTGNALFLYAETSVHLGSGQSFAAIDLAIQRERFTDLPMGASTGVKGVFRDAMERKAAPEDDATVLAAFGPDTDHADKHAGALAFTDLRLLLFPVRSLTGVFAWATCRFVLERLQRDLLFLNEGAKAPTGLTLDALPKVDKGAARVAAGSALVSERQVVLEEYALRAEVHKGVHDLGHWLARRALPAGDDYAFWRERLPGHLVLLHDDDFRDFTRHSTEVVARIQLNERKTTTGDGGNLFYQENLPAESLLYSLVLAQDDLSGGGQSAADLLAFVRGLDGHRLQIGGDASTGRGLTHVRSFQPAA